MMFFCRCCKNDVPNCLNGRSVKSKEIFANTLIDIAKTFLYAIAAFCTSIFWEYMTDKTPPVSGAGAELSEKFAHFLIAAGLIFFALCAFNYFRRTAMNIYDEVEKHK